MATLPQDLAAQLASRRQRRVHRAQRSQPFRLSPQLARSSQPRQRPRLSTSHPYLCLLRGSYRDVEIEGNAEPNFNTDQQSPTGVSRSLSPSKAELEQWEITIKNFQALRFPPIQITVPGRKNPGFFGDRSQARAALRLSCDHCQEPIDLSDPHFHCEVCQNTNQEDYSVCMRCKINGVYSHDAGHSLRLATRAEVSIFGSAWRVYVEESGSHQAPQKRGTMSIDEKTYPPEASLGDIIEEYLAREDVQSQLQEEGSLMPPSTDLASICITTWQLICNFLIHDQLQTSLDRVLSPIHRKVIQLLLEWWLGEIQDHRLTYLGITGMFIQCKFDLQLSDQNLLLGLGRSPYNDAMLQLFQWEMGYFDHFTEPEMRIHALHNHRINAARHASSQRLAFFHLFGTSRPPWLQPYETVERSMEIHFESMAACLTSPMALCYSEDAQSAADYCIWVQMTSAYSLQLALKNLQLGEQTLGPKQLSSSIAPCPWLSRVRKAEEFPNFLWDKIGKRTIRTQDFDFFPEYTVVSHTWGRWKKRGNYPDVTLPNVPWAIPQNWRFPVEDLGIILSSVPGNTRYVWFDLVCIPQVTDDYGLKNVLNQEIAKQAAIFSQASIAIAWYCDVDDFTGLEDICHVLATNTLRYPGFLDPSTLIQATDDSWERLSTYETNRIRVPLTQSDPEEGDSQSWEKVLHGWFSSLWTTQEACMRPDMWLCSRDWKPLVSSKSGSVIPLDCVLSLISMNSDAIRGWTSDCHFAPPSAEERLSNSVYKDYEVPSYNLLKSPTRLLITFAHIIMAAGIPEIPDISRAQIIVQCNQRFCKKQNRRAEAIMSVLGVKEWFLNPTLSADEKALVFGKYPLAFIKELRQKLGDFEFFSTNIVRDFWSKAPPGQSFDDHILGNDETRGTLLPISPIESNSGFRKGINQLHVPDEINIHTTLKDWHINPDGSVFIPSAWVIMSTSNPTNPSLGIVHVCDYSEVSQKGWDGIVSQEPLHEWITRREYECFAIGLRRDRKWFEGNEMNRIEGILLRKLENGHMIRVGWFSTASLDGGDYGFSSVIEVGWTVR